RALEREARRAAGSVHASRPRRGGGSAVPPGARAVRRGRARGARQRAARDVREAAREGGAAPERARRDARRRAAVKGEGEPWRFAEARRRNATVRLVGGSRTGPRGRGGQRSGRTRTYASSFVVSVCAWPPP